MESFFVPEKFPIGIANIRFLLKRFLMEKRKY
jgi:hypothetical protein